MKSKQKILEMHGSERGFTIIELLVSVAISGLVMGSIYMSYYSQQKSYLAQEQVVDVQQNLRSALYFMEREIRMAGCDPKPGGSPSALTTTYPAIKIATATQLEINEDVGGGAGGAPNGVIDPGENIVYTLNSATGEVTRTAGAGAQVIATNIECLNFVYFDANRTPTATLADIRAVQIAIVARSEKIDNRSVSRETFTNLSGTSLTPSTWVGGSYPKNDQYHRKILTCEVACRNLGM